MIVLSNKAMKISMRSIKKLNGYNLIQYVVEVAVSSLSARGPWHEKVEEPCV